MSLPNGPVLRGASQFSCAFAFLLALASVGAIGCAPEPLPPGVFGSGSAAAVKSVSPSGPSSSDVASPAVVAPVDNVYPEAKRLVAFGDVHGDLAATRRVLRLAGAIDETDRWIGGDLFVVQVGDQLDRGDDDRAILDLFQRLAGEAKAAGGHFISLNGNHEIMNASMDFRYANDAANRAFSEFIPSGDASIERLPEPVRGRAGAFRPGGVYAKVLATQPVYVKVGDTLMVHGGVLPKHVAYGLDRIDRETRAWLRGEAPSPPPPVTGEDGVVWLRLYSQQVGPQECRTLSGVLASVGAKRLVMGHTPQKPGVSIACDGQAIRIDTGLSAHYGGPTEALEVVDGRPRVLK